jgi:hypothetical protein
MDDEKDDGKDDGKDDEKDDGKDDEKLKKIPPKYHFIYFLLWLVMLKFKINNNFHNQRTFGVVGRILII